MGQITQPSTRRAHRVHPAIMRTAVPVAPAQCPTARAMLRISGCTRGGCTRKRFPDITCNVREHPSVVLLRVHVTNHVDTEQSREHRPLLVWWRLHQVFYCCLPHQDHGAELFSYIGSGASHLLDAVKLMQPGCVLPARQRVLTLEAVMAVHQPRLQLLALSTEPQLRKPHKFTFISPVHVFSW